MRKKLIPILVVLVLVIVGTGGYMMGRQSNNPSSETPPAQSSTPEVTPIAAPLPEPSPENTTPEPTPEPSIEQSQSGFATVTYPVYVRQQYLANGVNVVDDYKNINSADTLFVTDKSAGSMYLCVGVGYGDAEGYIQVMDLLTAKIGYAEESKFTADLANDSVDIKETQKTPEIEASKAEEPKVETPKQETPKQETPKQETPKQENPKQETPKQETPKQETPKQQNNSGIPDYLLNSPNRTSPSEVTVGSGLEGGHVGEGPGDGISWNN